MRLDRREALGLLGGGAVALALGACSTGGRDSARRAATPTTNGPVGTAAGQTTCTLAPEVTQGPFWLTDHPEASDLVQDRRGVPFDLTLTVVDQSCRPINGAKVDVWHCDAGGAYAGIGSGPGGPGGPGGAASRTSPANWLQGYQVTGPDGTVHFKTIYPGGYPGRAVHIHMKVFVGGAEHHTGQLFFPDDLSKQVFRDAAYRAAQHTPNAQDSIFRDAGSAALLGPQPSTPGYSATAQLGVRA